MDLFEQQERSRRESAAPLAVRLRPRTLDEFVGQQHFLGPGKLLRRLLQADRLSSAIFYGPPGSGKTTLAHVIAGLTRAEFVPLNAAAAGVREVRAALAEARTRLEVEGRRTILFVDELHRFNRAQQDILLGDVEEGVVILIGATTENPFFSVNAPLVSRSQIFQFEPLRREDIVTLLHRALQDSEHGLGGLKVRILPEAMEHWARTCDGDARRALTALEVAVRSQMATRDAADSGRELVIDLAIAAESIQRKAIVYDGTGDEHYDAASALIKSMRGSDPDAAVYWLARMLEAGEDPRFIARRIAICAAEDIGNADPMALVLANAAFQVTLQIGMPECQLVLAQAATYLAGAPKSNAAAMAIWEAAADVRENRTVPVPRHLRDAHYRGAARLDHGGGYAYPHDQAEGYVQQDYLGVERTYYRPADRGHERVIAEYLARIRKGAGPQGEPAGPDPSAPQTARTPGGARPAPPAAGLPGDDPPS